MLLAQLAQGLETLVNLALGFERIDGRVIDQLAGGIDHRHLDPGADAGSSPMVQRMPAGAAISRSLRFMANTLIARLLLTRGCGRSARSPSARRA